MAKPALILVGADKGGVGKTTVARTLLDYFTAHHVPWPLFRGRRRFKGITDIYKTDASQKSGREAPGKHLK